PAADGDPDPFRRCEASARPVARGRAIPSRRRAIRADGRSAAMNRAFPYIVGSPRSGTTLLRLMLNAHPELAIPPEAPFVVAAPPWFRDGPRTFDAGRAVTYFLSREWFPVWSIERDALAEAMPLGASLTWADAVRRVFGVYARTCGKPLAGAKTPLHV